MAQTGDAGIVLDLHEGVFLLGLDLVVVGLFGDHEVVRIQHPVLGVFQQSAHLFFAEDHFPRIGLLRLGGVLVQFAQLFEPPVGVGAHRAEFQEVENPVAA